MHYTESQLSMMERNPSLAMQIAAMRAAIVAVNDTPRESVPRVNVEEVLENLTAADVLREDN